jgi:hypothetical protein
VEYTPHTLKRWVLPSNYGGAHWDGFFVFLGQHRDSDSVTRSNFISGLKLLGGDSCTVEVVRENHWAVGWVEWIAIHESDAVALEAADEIAAALTDYPVVSDEHFSELEWTEACDYWENMSVRDRIHYCARAKMSIFAARRDWMPVDDNGNLQELLRD